MPSAGLEQKIPSKNSPLLSKHAFFVIKRHLFPLSSPKTQAPSACCPTSARQASSFFISALNSVFTPRVLAIYSHSLLVTNGLICSPKTQHAFWHSKTFPPVLSNHFPPFILHPPSGEPSWHVPNSGSKQVPNLHPGVLSRVAGKHIEVHLELHSLAGYSWQILPSFPLAHVATPFCKSSPSRAETSVLSLKIVFISNLKIPNQAPSLSILKETSFPSISFII